jgi:hypothetical protein
MDFILSLASNPHARGDFTLEDEVGRTVRVKMIGRFSVTFWADHPVCEVKVTHIKALHK